MHEEKGTIDLTATTELGVQTRRKGYETGLAIIGFLVFGCVILDRNAMYYIGPFVAKEFDLSETMFGASVGALSIGYAVFGLLAGPYADRHGRKKVMLFGIVAFSMMSGVTALARNFVQLVVARTILGATEGTVTTTLSAIVSTQSTPRRRGLNIGIVFSSSTLIGFVVAPIALTQLATGVGWRWAFALAGIPGLLVAILAWRFVSEKHVAQPSTEAESKSVPAKPRGQFRSALRIHNVRVSFVVAVLIGVWLSGVGAFVPRYLTTTGYHLDPRVMGTVVAAGGIGGFIGQLVMGALSDRRGRRSVILLGLALLSCYAWVVPLIAPNVALLSATLFVFSFGQVAITLAVATIPPESVPSHLAASAVAVPVFGIELGAFGGPILIGAVADLTGNPAMPLWLGGLATALALLVALRYRETAGRRAARAGVSPAQ